MSPTDLPRPDKANTPAASPLGNQAGSPVPDQTVEQAAQLAGQTSQAAAEPRSLDTMLVEADANSDTDGPGLLQIFAGTAGRFAPLSAVVADAGLAPEVRLRAYTVMWPPFAPGLAAIWFKATDMMLAKSLGNMRINARGSMERAMAMFLLPDEGEAKDRRRSFLEFAQLHGDPTTRVRADIALAQLEKDPFERSAYLQRAADVKDSVPFWRMQAHHLLAAEGVQPLYNLSVAKDLAQTPEQLQAIAKTADRVFNTP